MTDPEIQIQHGNLADIRSVVSAGRLSWSFLTAQCLERIEAHNHSGVALNCVRAVSNRASDAARSADARLRAGRVAGPLDGIPVLVKDNILTGEDLTSTAGVKALEGFQATREATVITRLKQAGAIILGKTNMTELADYVSDTMPSEFSGAGGIVRNPHGVAYGRGQGSSVGSAACVAAGFAPIAIGTETQNSIQEPAARSSVVGFKPSVGTVSRAGIVPLVPSQDSPGILTRNVSDAALVWSVIRGPDARDTATFECFRDASSASVSIKGLRLGVPRRCLAARTEFDGVQHVFDSVLSLLSKAGATIVDPCDLPSADQLQEVRSSVFRTEFKEALNQFLLENGAPCGIGSLNALIAWNERHPTAIPYGQSLLIAANDTRGLQDESYLRDRARDISLKSLSRDRCGIVDARGRRIDRTAIGGSEDHREGWRTCALNSSRPWRGRHTFRRLDFRIFWR